MKELPSTGHEVVDAIGRICLQGDIIPSKWYRHPSLKTESGNTNLLAITILAHIVNAYRPEAVWDKGRTEIVGYRKPFEERHLRAEYGLWAWNLGYSKGAIRKAVTFLESRKFISKRFGAVWHKDSDILESRVLFVVPDPAMILRLCTEEFDSPSDSDQEDDFGFDFEDDPSFE